MIVLQASNLERRFGSDVLFSDVSLAIQSHSRIALVGRNGTGKSTLLKMLAGIEKPDEGTISKSRNVSISYMDQHTAVNSERTIYEEMLAVFAPVLKLLDEAQVAAERLADETLMADEQAYAEALTNYDQLQEKLNRYNAYGYESEIRMVLHGFQFYEDDYDKPINELSGGQRTRLALAKILLEKRDVMILDEPTNHLDIETLTWLEEYLPKYPGAILIVSHDRYFLDAVTNETYEMTHHRMNYYKGNYSYYLKERAVRLEQEMKAYEKQQDKIAKLEDYVQRNIVRASTTKMAQSRRKQLEKMEKIEKPQADQRSVNIRFSTECESGNVVLTAEQLAIGYQGEVLAEPIDINLRKQQAIAIVGPNGIGKSTLLKTLIQEIPPVAGEVHLGANVDMGYYDQELGNLNSKKDVLHELWDEHPTTPEQDIRTVLGGFLFSGNDVEKSVGSLSGGEKARLELAKLAMEHDNLLILDEPTNHLDIDSKEVLEDALINYDGTLLFVSHDRYFINRIATQVIEIDESGSTLYLGDYDYYLHKKAEEEYLEALQAEETPESSPEVTTEGNSGQENYQRSKEQQKRERKLKRQMATQEERLEAIETEIDQLHEAMTEPDNMQDHEKLQALTAQVNDLEAEQLEVMSAWEETAEALEE